MFADVCMFASIRGQMALHSATILVPICIHCLNCTKIVQLVIMKIFTLVNTVPQGAVPYFKAKCTKFDFGWGSAPDPAGGAYSAPKPIAGF